MILNRKHFAATCLLACGFAAASSAFGQNTGDPPAVDYPRYNVTTGYRVDADWPAERSEHEWKAMPGVAIDENGLIWTLNRGDMPVQVYSPQGELVSEWGRNRFLSVHQIRLGPHGHVWIADSKAHAVYKFDRDGRKLLTIGIPGEYGEDLHHLNSVTDMVESPTGEVFISDGYRNNRVVVADSSGRLVREWGELGTNPGQFSLPHSIAQDSNGHIYVADRNNSRVQVFTSQGEFVAEWANLCQPWTVRITSNDEVFVAGTSPTQWRDDDVQAGIPPKDQIVMKFDTSGRVLAWWRFPQGPDEADAGVQAGELSWVHGLDIDANGNLYLGDIMGQRVQRFLLSQ